MNSGASTVGAPTGETVRHHKLRLIRRQRASSSRRRTYGSCNQAIAGTAVRRSRTMKSRAVRFVAGGGRGGEPCVWAGGGGGVKITYAPPPHCQSKNTKPRHMDGAFYERRSW